MPKYIAKQSIGHFRPGEEIEGLEDQQLQALLASGAIEEYNRQNKRRLMIQRMSWKNSKARSRILRHPISSLKLIRQLL
jgi:hypothetical protein